MRKIGIYGGTFNPPHLGHIQGASYAKAALGLDKVLMLPDGVAPHKTLPEHSPTPQQRLEMLEAGLQEAGLEASGLCLEREGESYACDTVSQIRSLYPDAQLFWLLGSDMVENFPNWRKAQEILSQTTLAVMCRGGKEEAKMLKLAKETLEAMGGKVILLENPVIDISSTQLRRMLAFRCADDFLPWQVAAYIQRNGLYGVNRNLRNLPIDQLEQEVIRLLKPNRVAHVLGCRQTAVELAKIYGVDETDAARAALLHDITKALDGPLQLTLCDCYGTILDDFSQRNPKTLHALTGSLVAQRIFGENQAVVDAIRCHTTGKADMNTLEKIIYVADYMEPNRDFPGVEALRQMAYTDISKALLMGLEMTLDMLRSQQRDISPESVEAYIYLKSHGV